MHNTFPIFSYYEVFHSPVSHTHTHVHLNVFWSQLQRHVGGRVEHHTKNGSHTTILCNGLTFRANHDAILCSAIRHPQTNVYQKQHKNSFSCLRSVKKPHFLLFKFERSTVCFSWWCPHMISHFKVKVNFKNNFPHSLIYSI